MASHAGTTSTVTPAATQCLVRSPNPGHVSARCRFFHVQLETVSLDSDALVRTENGCGNIAPTFDNWNSLLAGQPTQRSRLSVFDNDKYRSQLTLTLHPRNDHCCSFNVTLAGISNADLVGVAGADSKPITIRLQDCRSQTTLLNLNHQPQTSATTAPATSAATIPDPHVDSVPSKLYVPDGEPTYWSVWHHDAVNGGRQ